MLVTMGLFCGLAAYELMLWLIPSLWLLRVMGGILLAPLAIVSIALLVLNPSIITACLLVTSLYRLVNLLRLVKARVNERYLRRSTLVTSLRIITTQAAIITLWRWNLWPQASAELYWAWVSYGCLAVVVVLTATTLRHLWTTRPPKLEPSDRRDSQLPTLTVAIPARNETEDLEECLQSLVASNYPKLEILVLDDCSQNKRTPEIIRSFAHDGVRFLEGKVPEDNWLTKNQAYRQLYEAANGELILFCGVDVRFAPTSLRMLVAAFEHKHKSMISIIPQNAVPPLLSTQATTLLQPIRYAWELALPRRWFRRPPVLSTCWMIKRDVLQSAGGFGAVSRSIVPERYFARVSAVKDGYSFMQSSARTGITSNKSAQEQRSTAVRVQYPRVHRRIEVALLLSAAELLVCVLPYVRLSVGIVRHEPALTLVPTVLTVVLLTVMYTSIVALTYRMWLARSLVLLPIAVLYDVILLNYSMLRYEFFSVVWKDRNVCIPVMHVVDRLPEPSAR